VTRKPVSWLVLDMDDKVLRREPTRRAAIAWAERHLCAPVRRGHRSASGAYEYEFGPHGGDMDGSFFIERDDVALDHGWPVDVPPLFPFPDDPHLEADTPERHAALAALRLPRTDEPEEA
jgi:hypothetical protein